MSNILLEWDQIGTRFYETGCDRGVLYLQKNGKYPKGVAWSGLVSVSENPTGAEENPYYADNMKYLVLRSAEELGLTIECYYYPDEWNECDGSAELAPGVSLRQQKRSAFGLCYRTKIGNDTEGQDYGYKLHLIYGCTAATSDKQFETVNDSPNAVTMSYEVSTTPVSVNGFKPVSSIEIDSTKVDPVQMAEIEEILYGKAGTGEDDAGTDAYLPLPDELKDIFKIAG